MSWLLYALIRWVHATRLLGYAAQMRPNVFVLGVDDLNLAILRGQQQGEYSFHPLLTKEELLDVEEINLPQLLERAQQELHAFDGPIDAIIGYWDFPVSSMVPILCQRFGLSSAPLEAVAKCEHKYWSRLEQRKVIDEVPEFAIMDCERDDELPPNLDYPIWLKPVKSASSELAYHVTDHSTLLAALAGIREGLGRFGEPFGFVLEQLELPPEIAEVGAAACLAEEAIGGQQVTVEGYTTGDETRVYGIIDSLTYPDTSSFLRYQYPSALPEGVCQRLVDCSTKVIDQVGLQSTTFNIEYFWDAANDRIRLLEINPRHSQSHAIMFEHVEGVSNHEVLVQLALGRSPVGLNRQGRYDVAAKWFLRTFEDGVVTRCPSDTDVEKVEQEISGVTVRIVAESGGRLSDLPQQDSYSFELAQVFVGAGSEAELVEKYERCVQMLPFDIER